MLARAAHGDRFSTWPATGTTACEYRSPPRRSQTPPLYAPTTARALSKRPTPRRQINPSQAAAYLVERLATYDANTARGLHRQSKGGFVPAQIGTQSIPVGRLRIPVAASGARTDRRATYPPSCRKQPLASMTLKRVAAHKMPELRSQCSAPHMLIVPGRPATDHLRVLVDAAPPPYRSLPSSVSTLHPSCWVRGRTSDVSRPSPRLDRWAVRSIHGNAPLRLSTRKTPHQKLNPGFVRLTAEPRRSASGLRLMLNCEGEHRDSATTG